MHFIDSFHSLQTPICQEAAKEDKNVAFEKAYIETASEEFSGSASDYDSSPTPPPTRRYVNRPADSKRRGLSGGRPDDDIDESHAQTWPERIGGWQTDLAAARSTFIHTHSVTWSGPYTKTPSKPGRQIKQQHYGGRSGHHGDRDWNASNANYYGKWESTYDKQYGDTDTTYKYTNRTGSGGFYQR